MGVRPRFLKRSCSMSELKYSTTAGPSSGREEAGEDLHYLHVGSYDRTRFKIVTTPTVMRTRMIVMIATTVRTIASSTIV